MKLTNEQIQAILDGAPEGATHIEIGVKVFDGHEKNFYYRRLRDHFHVKGYTYEFWSEPRGIWDFGGVCDFSGALHNLSDLREILTLRQEVERLKTYLKIVMPVIDELVQNAVEPSDIYADDLQDRLVKAGVLKVVPFDPTKHYDYTHETEECQDWVTWSDWYEKTKEKGHE